MQEYIGIKYFTKCLLQDSERSSDEVYVEDDDDHLADAVIVPASVCNVVMKDWSHSSEKINCDCVKKLSKRSSKTWSGSIY